MSHGTKARGVEPPQQPTRADPPGSRRACAGPRRAGSSDPRASDGPAPSDSNRAAVNAAIERIVLTHADLILRLAYARLGSRADAQDVCQTVLLRLLRSSQAGTVWFRDAEHEKAWVIRATINACIDARRGSDDGRVVSLDALREGRGWEAAGGTDPDDIAISVLDGSREPRSTAAEELDEIDELEGADDPNDPDGPEAEVLAAVNQLPPAHRQAVYLRYYEGYSTREIAELTGERETTIRKRLSRAYARLRDLLEGGAQ